MNVSAVVASVVTLLVIDLIWVNTFMLHQYRTLIKDIQQTPMETKYGYAIIAYLLMAVGLVVFVLPKACCIQNAILYGALFGIIIYGVYNCTIAAVLNKWKLRVVIIDMCWGAFVYSIAALVYVLVSRIRP